MSSFGEHYFGLTACSDYQDCVAMSKLSNCKERRKVDCAAQGRQCHRTETSTKSVRFDEAPVIIVTDMDAVTQPTS